MSDDTPIYPMDYIGGTTVVDIGDARVARGMSRREYSACSHKSLVYDKQERRVWCQDCEREVYAFDAFTGIVEQYDRAIKSIEKRRKQVEEAERFAVRGRAAKVMDEAWRSRNMIPACPHCRRGIFPADVVNGVGMVGKDYAAALAAKDSPDGR